MTSYTLILCEGAHDQAAIASLASICSGWAEKKKIPAALPQQLENLYPDPRKNKFGAYKFERPPTYLEKRDNWLEIRERGGFDSLISETTLKFIDRAAPDAIGCVVDADDKGVAMRLLACQEWLGQRYKDAKKLEAGSVSAGKPRLGIWVAPDNESDGNIERILLDAARTHNKKLVQRASLFVNALEKLEPGKWSSEREKAVLGALNQTVLPGASLAVCLAETQCRFDSSLATQAPFAKLCEFVERLAGFQ